MPRIKGSSVTKKRGKTNKIKLSYDDKLDVISIINNHDIKSSNIKAVLVANKIIKYQNNVETKAKADKFINSISASIIKDNREKWHNVESKKIYEEFIKRH